jgi:hypothetical protein
MPIKLANNASGTLATAISASDTGIALTTGDGAEFPTLGAGDYFYATITSSGGTQEIVKATARSGDSLTVVRAQEGTTAAGFAAGSRFELRVTAASVEDAVDEAEAYALGLDTTLRADLAASSGTSLVGFLQAGTSAVARTTQAKLRETVSVKDFGAVGDGVTDDTAAIQAAIDTGYDVIFPGASYVISAPLEVGSQRLIGGVGQKFTNRAQSAIRIFGNHAAFVNKSGEISFVIDGFYIYYSNTTPTVSTGNDQKIAFKFVQNGLWPAYMHINNCTVRGAWIGYYDYTGTYLSKLTQVACRNTRTGFYKYAGTTVSFDTCSSSEGVQGFYIESILSPILTNCSADNLTISAGNTGNFFRNLTSLTINGWDGEGNTIDGNNASYMLFDSAIANVTGVTGVSNVLSCPIGSEVYFIKVQNSSYVTFDAFKINRDLSWLSFNGTGGDCFTMKAITNSYVTAISSNFSAPIGGAPSTRNSVVASSAQIALIHTFVNETFSGISARIDANNSEFRGSLIAGRSGLIAAGSQYGGFGNERLTVQSSANTTLFSTTGSSGAGVSATFARGNDGPVQFFFRNGLPVGHVDVTSVNTARYYTASTVYVGSGPGSPEGAVAGSVGSIYTRTDGGAGTTLYVKESGSGSTGWVAK